ncbi:type II secretion system protein GspD, partial [Pseudoalteromonas undina]
IIEPNVRGKVYVLSYELMDESLYYQFLLNVLEVYGYSAVEIDNGIIKIEKSSEDKKSNVTLYTENSPASVDM